MGKKISKRHEKIFRNEYSRWVDQIASEILEYCDAMVEAMNELDLKTFTKDSHFTDMAKQAVFHKMDVIYKQEANVLAANELLEIQDDDLL